MKKPDHQDSEMREEYGFSDGVRGKSSARFAEGSNVVVLDPDVAAELRTRLFGVIPVAAFAVVRGSLSRDHVRYVHHFVVMSVLATSFYYFAFASGTSLLPSGVAGARSGSIPLFSFRGFGDRSLVGSPESTHHSKRVAEQLKRTDLPEGR